MTTIVACPACQQSLQLPPEMMDREVRCPGCQQVFKAASSAVRAAPPPPMPEAVPEWEKPRGEEELEKPLDEDEAQELEEEAREAERRKRKKVEKKARKGSSGSKTFDEVMKRQQQRAAEHRGPLILVFGILAVMCSVGFIGLVFGLLAWQWGNNDLHEMMSGRMDRQGETLTNVGRILGMIGVGLFCTGALA